jgi:hypothetical protein
MLEKVSTHTPSIPVEVRLKVVEEWLVFGNLKQVATRNEIDYSTIKRWKTQPWWKEFEDELLAQRRIGTQNRIGAIVDVGLEVVQDRLENGEFFVTKQGEVARRPVGLRDASAAVNGLMQRQSILEKQTAARGNTEATKSIEQQLAFLADEFAKFNNRSKAGAQAIEFVEKV